MNIDEKVTEYGKLDSQIKSLTKTLNTEKTEIKDYLLGNNLDKYSAGGFKVSCVKSTRTETDDVKMLEILKAYWLQTEQSLDNCPFIKTVQILNSDALESALYHSKLPIDVVNELNECIKTTDVYALKCSVDKGKSND